MKISLLSKTLDIELEHKEGVKRYQLREMTAAQRDSYLNRLNKRMQGTGADKVVRDFEGMHADLLELCLYRGNDLVTRDEVQAWPASVTQALFEEAQKMNGLVGEEGVGNDPKKS